MIGPDHPDFENLPRREQANIYAAFGWTQKNIAEELEVSLNTVKRWFNPEYEQASREAIRTYQKSEKGRAWKREFDKKQREKRARQKRERPLSTSRTATYMRDYMRKYRSGKKATQRNNDSEISRQIRNP